MAALLDFPTVLAQLQWWFAPGNQHGNGYANVSQEYGQNGETGVDIAMPYHTPVYAVASGPVSGIDYYGGGGVVTTDVASDKALYYQHLSDIVVAKGQQVNAGQLIGYSGGQVGYGDHPSTSQFSSGPHIEIGLNWWHPLGKNVNPIPFLQSLIPAYAASNVSTSSQGSSISNPGIQGVVNQPLGFNSGVGPIQDTDQPSAALCLFITATNSQSLFPKATVACLVPATQAIANNPLTVIAENIAGFGSAMLGWIANPLRIVKLTMGMSMIVIAIIIVIREPLAKGALTVLEAVQPETIPVAEAAKNAIGKKGARGVQVEHAQEPKVSKPRKSRPPKPQPETSQGSLPPPEG